MIFVHQKALSVSSWDRNDILHMFVSYRTLLNVAPRHTKSVKVSKPNPGFDYCILRRNLTDINNNG